MNNYIKAGLVPVGKNEEGEMEYIGTKQEWEKLDEMSLAKTEAEINFTNELDIAEESTRQAIFHEENKEELV